MERQTVPREGEQGHIIPATIHVLQNRVWAPLVRPAWRRENARDALNGVQKGGSQGAPRVYLGVLLLWAYVCTGSGAGRRGHRAWCAMRMSYIWASGSGSGSSSTL